MQRFLFSRVLEQTRHHQHQISRRFLTLLPSLSPLVPVPLLSLSRFSKITASDSTSLPINPKTLEEALNNIEGISCNQAEGAMFPRINLPRKAIEATETAKTAPDVFYCKRLLNATGSRFGQVPLTTWHSRCTILRQEGKIPATANRVRELHKSSINDIPKRTKFQKHHRGRVKGISSHGNLFGKYALQTLEPGWITSRQIEAGRRAITRNVQRSEKIRVHIFADKPVTVRPPETRMGRGKGAPAFWVAVVKPGNIIYEMGGVSEIIARKAISIAASKLSLKTRFIISKF